MPFADFGLQQCHALIVQLVGGEISVHSVPGGESVPESVPTQSEPVPSPAGSSGGQEDPSRIGKVLVDQHGIKPQFLGERSSGPGFRAVDHP